MLRSGALSISAPLYIRDGGICVGSPCCSSCRYRWIVRHLRHAGPHSVQSREIHGLLAQDDADAKAYPSSWGAPPNSNRQMTVYLRVPGTPAPQQTNTRTPYRTTATKYRCNPHSPRPPLNNNRQIDTHQRIPGTPTKQQSPDSCTSPGHLNTAATANRHQHTQSHSRRKIALQSALPATAAEQEPQDSRPSAEHRNTTATEYRR